MSQARLRNSGFSRPCEAQTFAEGTEQDSDFCDSQRHSTLLSENKLYYLEIQVLKRKIDQMTLRQSQVQEQKEKSIKKISHELQQQRIKNAALEQQLLELTSRKKYQFQPRPILQPRHLRPRQQRSSSSYLAGNVASQTGNSTVNKNNVHQPYARLSKGTQNLEEQCYYFSPPHQKSPAHSNLCSRISSSPRRFLRTQYGDPGIRIQ